MVRHKVNTPFLRSEGVGYSFSPFLCRVSKSLFTPYAAMTRLSCINASRRMLEIVIEALAPPLPSPLELALADIESLT